LPSNNIYRLTIQSRLSISTCPKPEPTGHDIQVAVKAVAVNPVDTNVRSGRGKDGVIEDPPRVIGWDASGVVQAVGDQVTLFKPDDEV
jgi:NADPH2:quinone reductase